MSKITLAISDLHLADGHSILDGFGDRQQAAFEGLLQSTHPQGPLGQDDEVELVINGDCFDLLVIPPYITGGTSDVATALEKLAKIIAAHQPFFAALRAFIAFPQRKITFITGNHDLELCFAEVREHIRLALHVDENNSAVYFCPTRSYRPLTDVYFEHGNHYDFWSHSIKGLWDEQGQPLTVHPATIKLPVGSHYFLQAAHQVSIQYPYFDHFEPSVNTMRQIAMLCLLAPDLLVETAKHTMEMLSTPHTALADLAPGDERIPSKLFEQAMLDFSAFQQDMAAHKTDWHGSSEDNQVSQHDIMEFMTLRETLTQPRVEAVAALCTPNVYQMDEDVARGMHRVLSQDPTLRYAIAGHTHMLRVDPINQGLQTYLNTASWTTRLALPAPGEITPALVQWLQHPDWSRIPLRDVTQFVFAMVHTATDGVSSASLCAWEGGVNGRHKVLA